MNDASLHALQQFFSPLFRFTAAYISVRLPSPIIDDLHEAAEDFKRAIRKMHDVDCVLRASETGYRFRDL